MVFCLTTSILVPQALAQTNTLTIDVVSARTEPLFPLGPVAKGDAISEYKYIINVDNTGTTDQRSPDPGTGCSPLDAGYPDSCNWVSIAGAASNSPIYTQGDQTDFGEGIDLPDGRYLISVLAAAPSARRSTRARAS